MSGRMIQHRALTNRRSGSKAQRSRRGMALVETAVVLSVWLILLFGLLDLGLAVLNANDLADAAQQVSRSAVVRGSDSSPYFTAWGPASYGGTAASGDDIAAQVANVVTLMPRSKVNILVEWLDGDNDEGDRVRTTLTYTHPLIVPKLFGFSSCQLTAVSTMRIAE